MGEHAELDGVKRGVYTGAKERQGGTRRDTYRVLLRGRDLLDGERVVEQAVAREVLLHVLLYELDTEIRVVDALDLVADAADCVFR